MFGLITKAAHEAEIAEYAEDLRRANEARHNWKASAKEWEAKFKKAVADLAAEVEQHRVLSKHALALEAEIAKFRDQRDRDNAGRRARREAKKGRA
ncbi:MAG TPA: hypothetical protein PKD99_12460 [Sphingopyxis sp.]|nr:hypothetical protein [Sphingopyxis sp.]HMP45911.1 hypothetical protein [Sphingopyxis sp.]